MPTLNELRQLRNSRFGRPRPRHGLRLLFWLANDFINFEYDEMFAESNPKYGCFGFHRFHNWFDKDDDGPLLPPNVIYYEVGNLNADDAKNLPFYVTGQNTGRLDNSNSDRIILAMDGLCIHRVYVTQHSDITNFSRKDTHRISQGLIKIIKRLSLTDFLREMEEEKEIPYIQQAARFHPDSRPTDWPNSDCMCTVCALFFVVIFLLLAMILVLFYSQRR